jgi:hypothetical protein
MIDPSSLLSRLEGVRQTGFDRWQARCPTHKDTSPSLSIRLTDDKLLINCFAGCSPDDILAALDLKWSDLFSDRWQAAEQAALAVANKRSQKILGQISLRDYASWVVAIAAADKRRGIEHDLADRATLALAVNILRGGQANG